MKRALRYLRVLMGGIVFFAALIALGRGAVWLTSEDALPGLSGPPQVFVWSEGFEDFGGYSGLIIDPDGAGFIAGSDRQHYVTGTVQRGADGAIIGVQGTTRWPVLLGKLTRLTRFQGDLEGLTRMADGRIGMVFENYARVQIMDAPGAVPQRIHPWHTFRSIFGNELFEAVATLPDGTLLALFQRDPRRGQGRQQRHTTTRAYRYDGTAFTGPAPFPVSKGFDVSGAETGPDGCLYVLERHYGLFTGFQVQLIRMDPFDWTAPRTLLYRSKPMSLGNAEAVALWDDGDTLIATLITDDGFPPGQPTRIIELPLHPAPGCVDQ